MIADPSGGTPSNINANYTYLKSIVGYNSIADNTGLSSVAVVAAKKL